MHVPKWDLLKVLSIINSLMFIFLSLLDFRDVGKDCRPVVKSHIYNTMSSIYMEKNDNLKRFFFFFLRSGRNGRNTS